MNEVYKEFDMDEGEETNFTNVTLAIDDTGCFFLTGPTLKITSMEKS